MFQRIRSFTCPMLLFTMAVVLISGVALGGNTVTIVGEVNDDFQIIAEGDQVYEIMMDDKGEELAGHSGEKVKITGEILEEGGEESVRILSYEVLE